LPLKICLHFCFNNFVDRSPKGSEVARYAKVDDVRHDTNQHQKPMGMAKIAAKPRMPSISLRFMTSYLSTQG
jgi:hypothetical protein